MRRFLLRILFYLKYIRKVNSVSLQKKERNTNIEILRFVLMCLICIWHLIVHGMQEGDVHAELTGYHPTILIFLRTLAAPAVYCFMFISGWYGIKFKLERLIELSILAFLCFWLTQSLTFYFFPGSYNPSVLRMFFFPISTEKWWFLTAYVMVYMIAPFINVGMDSVSKSSFTKILAIMTIVEVASIIKLDTDTGYGFYGLLYMYIVGRYLKKCPPPTSY